MSDCLFCRIIKREIPSKIAYEDEECLAFEDISPKAPTHLLLIPKIHIPTLNDISDKDRDLMGHLMLVVSKLAKERGLDKKGYRLNANCMESAGQSVFHIHFHILGGRNFAWPPG